MKEIIAFNVKELQRYFRICPGIFALLVFIGGYCLYNRLYYIALPIMLLGIIISGKRIHRWLLPLILGVSLCHLHTKAPWDTYKNQLPRSECSATVRGTMGSHCGNERQRWKCEFKLEQISFYGVAFNKCGGKVLAYFPNDVPYTYGATCTVEGAFLDFEDDLSRRYYKCRSLNYTFHANLVRDFSPARTLFAKLLELRQSLAERLTHHINGDDEAAIYQAMIFGIRDRLPNEVRETFVKSSTVHLFSISGLHIGLMGLCLVFFARLFCVPLRWRLPLTCLLLLAYVLISGAAPSALRAWLMVLLVIVSQSRWHVHSSENTLGIAGLLLLMANPFYLMHTGFVFSFVLVYVLLRSENTCRAFIDTMCEKKNWLPPDSAKTRFWRIWGRLLGTVLGSLAAWLGCCGVMMLWNGLVSFGSIMVNALIGPAALLLVAGALPKIALSFFWEGGSLVLGNMLGWLLKILLVAAEAASAPGLYCTGTRISPVMCFIYYALLWLAFSSMRPRLARYLAFAMLFTIIGCFHHSQQSRQFVLACASEKGGEPCIAFADRPHHAWLIQPGEWNASRKLLQELKQRGHADKIDILVQSHTQIPAAKTFMKGCQGQAVIFNAHKPKMAEFRAYAAYHGWNTYSQVPDLPVEITRISPGKNQITYNNNKYILEPCLRPKCLIIHP